VSRKGLRLVLFGTTMHVALKVVILTIVLLAFVVMEDVLFERNTVQVLKIMLFTCLIVAVIGRLFPKQRLN
jgi:hypothetical protein